MKILIKNLAKTKTLSNPHLNQDFRIMIRVILKTNNRTRSIEMNLIPQLKEQFK